MLNIMSFSFGFSGDDVEDEDLIEAGNAPKTSAQPGGNVNVAAIPVEEHQLSDLVGMQITSRSFSLPIA